MRSLSIAVTVALAAAPITNAFTTNAHAGIRNHLLSSITNLGATGNNADQRTPMRQGSYVALVTPMTPTGSIHIPELRSLLQFHLASGTDGLCILGTTGEASVMTMEERKLVLDVAVEECKGRIPILVGVGTIDPHHVKEQTLQAIDCGCDASLVVTPYYVKPPQRGLMRHFVDMADMGLPVCIYNVPGRTGVDISPGSIGAIADHENIVAVKEATGDVSRVNQLEEALRENGVDRNSIMLFSGDDGTTDDFVLLGGDGCISVTANVAPKQMHELMMAALNKDKNEVDRINAPLRSLHSDLFCESNPIPVKWAVKRIGKIDCAYLRPPMDELDPGCYERVESALNHAALIGSMMDPNATQNITNTLLV